MLGVQTPALPASLRRTNQRTVISLLFRLGSASRADLAKAAGISQPTAGKITEDLLRLGILQEAEPAAEHPGNGGATQRLGRPGQMLQLDGRRRRFLGIELGVSSTRISALPVAVKLRDEWDHSFPTPQSPEAWVKRLRMAAADVPISQVWGVLISVPGIVDEPTGKVIFCPNLHWLEKVDLAQLVRQVWTLPVLLVQEIRALALGHLTAEPTGEDFFLVDFGEGVGGAIVLDGKLYSHPMPLSGEFGHTPVPGNVRRCGCGAVGCLETLVSRRGLIESFKRAQGRGRPSGASQAGRYPVNAGAWDLLVCTIGERGIERWLSEALEATGQVIAGALNVLGIQHVVVTGILTELPGCAERLAAEIAKGAMWGRFGEVTCRSAPHRRAAGLVGVGIDRLVLPADEEKGLMSEHSK
jgi:predicted NBD/HSP70 family sugar kinase